MVSGVVNGCALRQPSAPAAASLRRLSDDAVSPIDRLEAPDDFAPGDGPPLLPVALRMADDIAELLSGDDGDVLIAGVHGLSARTLLLAWILCMHRSQLQLLTKCLIISSRNTVFI